MDNTGRTEGSESVESEAWRKKALVRRRYMEGLSVESSHDVFRLKASQRIMRVLESDGYTEEVDLNEYAEFYL